MEALSDPGAGGAGAAMVRAVVVFGLAAIPGCTAAGSICADGVDRGLKSSGSCGPEVTVTVKSGSSCVPSAFTGFNSELAGFPGGTNDAHPVQAAVALADGGSELRQCQLSPSADAGFRVSCVSCAPDGGADDAGCVSIGGCVADLVPN